MDSVERHAAILSSAAETYTQVRAAATIAGEYEKLLDTIQKLKSAGMDEQADQLQNVLRATSGMQALPPPPRPRGRPRKDEGGEA